MRGKFVVYALESQQQQKIFPSFANKNNNNTI